MGITDMHPELTQLLGQLKYRTSYGQNVLKHLVESAHLAGMMASELGLDPVLIKRGTLLHDIGKALTHEVQGSHALIGAEIARRYGEPEDVVHAIEAHHNEVEVRTVEAVLTQAADAISGGRPGARRESLEAYVKRLERLEQIARPSPASRRSSPCRRAGRCGSWSSPATSTNPGAGHRPRRGQAGAGRANLPWPDPGDRRQGIPRHRIRPLALPPLRLSFRTGTVYLELGTREPGSARRRTVPPPAR